MTRIGMIRLSAVLLVCLVASVAEAEEPTQLDAAMDRGKVLYNNARYEEASALFVRAAQLDPGANKTMGAPYRNLARCMFWLERYDAAVHWYDVYRSGWPGAADADAVFAERRTANERRSSPGDPVDLAAVYDRSVRELVKTLEERLDAGAQAYTEQGGGSYRLYQLALDRGYAMPNLGKLTRQLQEQLMAEIEARWKVAPGSPLPALGPNAESVATSKERLRALRELQPGEEAAKRIEAYERLVMAWLDYGAENFSRAAAEFEDAAELLPELGYLPYARALAQLKAGDKEGAVLTLSTKRGEAPEQLQPYYKLLEAEARVADGKHKAAAVLYWSVLDGN